MLEKKNNVVYMLEKKNNVVVVVTNNNVVSEEDLFDFDMGHNHLVHSQVRKIKKESETEEIKDWSPGQPEIRHALQHKGRQHSKSRLGLTSRHAQPISTR